jgi:hypothetical protein
VGDRHNTNTRTYYEKQIIPKGEGGEKKEINKVNICDVLAIYD